MQQLLSTTQTYCIILMNVLYNRYIWGRGAQDVKVTVFAMLEAVTALLEQG